MKDKRLIELYAKYSSAKVAEKMVRKLSEMTPQQIGRSLLSTKMPKQRLINIEIVRH